MNKKQLQKLYDAQSLSEMAADLKTDYVSAWTLLKEQGVRRRVVRKPDLSNPDWLHYAYWEKGMNLTEMSKLVDTTPATVMNHMESFGIPRRPRGIATSESSGTVRLNRALVRYIRQLHAKGVKQSKIRYLLATEKNVEVAKGTIHLVVEGHTWKDVTA